MGLRWGLGGVRDEEGADEDDRCFSQDVMGLHIYIYIININDEYIHNFYEEGLLQI